MVDGEHVPGSESSAEQVDDAGEESPPGRGSAEEPCDDEQGAEKTTDGMVGHFAAGNFEYGEECEDVGDHHDEVGDGESENGDEVLPERGFSGPVSTDLGDRVLCEDEYADDDDEYSADDPEECIVLLDLRLEHRVEEEGDHGHECIGTGDPDSGYDSGASAFRECSLDAQYGHGADGNGGRNAHADTSEQGFNDLECHFAGVQV